MRGTGYAIAEIIWWLLAAGAIGFVLGWIVRTWGVKKRVTAEYEQTLAAERERATRLESELATRQEAVDQGQRALQDAHTTIEGLEAAAAAAAADVVPSADPAAMAVLAVPDDTLIAPVPSTIPQEQSPATPPDETQTAPTLFDLSDEATPEDGAAPPDQQPPPVT